jgi:hypothetical protein
VLLRDPRARRLLSGLGVSSLGDGMSFVTIAWLAVRIAPAGMSARMYKRSVSIGSGAGAEFR